MLFYHEQQSVTRVAELLDLSTDAVKQRLSRGRNLLRAEVAGIVERGLLQSAPGRAFTVGVIASLPIMTGTAKAATVTAVAARGVGSLNAAASMGALGAVAGSFAGLLGAWFGYSMSLKSARSDREREFIHKSAIVMMALVIVFCATIFVPLRFAGQWIKTSPLLIALVVMVPTLVYIAALFTMIFDSNRRIAQIRREDGTDGAMPDQIAAGLPPVMRYCRHSQFYESPTKLFGLPLLSVCFQGSIGLGDGKGHRAAVGWVAIGDRAFGILFASGNLAVGGIATGAVSVGFVSFGALAIGAIATGGAALGLGGLGGFAVGFLAAGGVAFGWKATQGGIAVAHDIAVGGLVSGKHANNEIARAFVADSLFFKLGELMMTPWAWWLLSINRLVFCLVEHEYAEQFRLQPDRPHPLQGWLLSQPRTRCFGKR